MRRRIEAQGSYRRARIGLLRAALGEGGREFSSLPIDLDLPALSWFTGTSVKSGGAPFAPDDLKTNFCLRSHASPGPPAAMTTAPATSQWLDERGLGHLTRAIGHLSLSQLKALLLSDYERVGVASLADRQALFRALQLAPSPQLSPQPSATDRWEPNRTRRRQLPLACPALAQFRCRGCRVDDDVLVDLDGDDDDFLTQVQRSGQLSWSRAGVNAPPVRPSRRLLPRGRPNSPSPPPIEQDLDLDQEFLLSPAPPAGAPGGNAAAAAPAHLLATLQDAPKIRVIVRKRPLNKKVGSCGSGGVGRCNQTQQGRVPPRACIQRPNRRLTAPARCPPPRPLPSHVSFASRKPPALFAGFSFGCLTQSHTASFVCLQETERGENDVLECDAPASTLFVNEPKVKVDLTKYTERHAFRWVLRGHPAVVRGERSRWLYSIAVPAASLARCATPPAPTATHRIPASTPPQPRFDDVFDERVDNSQLYEQAVQPLVGTIFRWGGRRVEGRGERTLLETA